MPVTADPWPVPSPRERAPVAAGESLSESYPAVASTVTHARLEVAGFAASVGVGAEHLDGVRLAVSEAVSNAVIHAYRGGAGEVQVRAAVISGLLWVGVFDHGCGHHAPAHRPGLGFGLGLMAEACQELLLSDRPGGGTEARMGFLIAGEPAAAS